MQRNDLFGDSIGYWRSVEVSSSPEGLGTSNWWHSGDKGRWARQNFPENNKNK